MTEMTEWQTQGRKKKPAEQKAPVPQAETKTVRGWYEGWGFSVSSAGATYKPHREAANREAYRTSSKSNPEHGYICHARTVWTGCKDTTVLTAAEAWTQLGRFHITVEERGEDHPGNPRYYFTWDLADTVAWDQTMQSTGGDNKQKTRCKEIAETFAGELKQL